MKNKVLYLSIILIFTISGFQSCKKSFLELEPKTGLLDANFYKTQGDALMALTAVYDAFSVQNWAIVPIMSDIWSDDEYKGGSNAADMQEWGNDENQVISPTDANTSQNLWNKCYSTIYRANQYLEKQSGITFIDTTLRIRYEAEAKFLRAYMYWDLARHFGWVPIILKVEQDVEAYKNYTQSTPQEVYTQVAVDLLYAVNNLPKTVTAAEAGRATKYAAEGLLARIYLFYNGFVLNVPELQVTGAWSDGTTTIDATMAKAAIDDIIAQPQYSLLPNYANLFDHQHENSSESIFSWQYSELGKSSDWGGWNIDGDFMAIFVGPRNPVGDPAVVAGWSFGTPTWSLNSEFEAGDPRQAATIYVADAHLTSYTKAYQNTGFFNYKYMPLKAYFASAGEPSHNFPYNFQDIRLADIYLMGAELNLGTTKADTYLNKVRTRALGAGKAKSNVTLADIKHERRVEFACEGLRKWDLMRWGLAAAKPLIDATFDPAQLPSGLSNPADFAVPGQLDVTTLGMFPIPSTEVAKTNSTNGVKNLQQYVPAYLKYN